MQEELGGVRTLIERMDLHPVVLRAIAEIEKDTGRKIEDVDDDAAAVVTALRAYMDGQALINCLVAQLLTPALADHRALEAQRRAEAEAEAAEEDDDEDDAPPTRASARPKAKARVRTKPKPKAKADPAPEIEGQLEAPDTV